MLVFQEREKSKYPEKKLWPPVVQKLYKSLSTSVRETNCTMQSIEIYPVDSATHLLSNWGLEAKERTNNSKFNPYMASSGTGI